MTRPSRQAIQAAAEALDAGRRSAADMTPREQAEAAFEPGGPSVDELEARIRRRRGLDVHERAAS